MLEIIKKSLLVGVGLAAMGKEKAEQLTKDICEQANVSKEEGEKLVREILDAGEAARKDLESQIRAQLRDQLSKLDVPSQKDLALLAARVDELEARLRTGKDAS